jgi:hypothetical protein
LYVFSFFFFGLHDLEQGRSAPYFHVLHMVAESERLHFVQSLVRMRGVPPSMDLRRDVVSGKHCMRR